MERYELSNRGKNLRKMLEAATGHVYICNSKNIPTVRVMTETKDADLVASLLDRLIQN